MTTVPAALAEAYALLREDLYDHLDRAEFLAMQCTHWDTADIATARRLIPDLVDVVRAALAQHETGPHGRCRGCLRSWPCDTVVAIHRTIKDRDRALVALAAS
ncbi:hypothetical protein SAMN05216266_103216 [Amycolatopsis marina]|uniref:Uncharacterized protein n=1 Tax=Amycolatopsis marina TaxID=490629 RepID=A0A1I0XIB8_9PSEU|nr:hypothetical protein [Amycolatopsis marina]SFB00417.1 hypothetical protein SAMN05216266_103216 [Amycolatopsis marina]